MPTWRKLHTKSLDSFDIQNMSSDTCRLFWHNLSLVSDKEGRGLMNGAWLRARAFPLREDIKADQLLEYMHEFQELKMIKIYEVCGREYFQICKWTDYQSTQKEADSNFPPNPNEVRTNSRPTLDKVGNKSVTDVDVDVDVEKDVDVDVDVDENEDFAAAASDPNLKKWSDIFTKKTGIASCPDDFKNLAKQASINNMVTALKELAMKGAVVSKPSGIVTPTVMVAARQRNQHSDFRNYDEDE